MRSIEFREPWMIDATIQGRKTQAMIPVKCRPEVYSVGGPATQDEEGNPLTDEQIDRCEYFEFNWGIQENGCFFDGYDVIKTPFNAGEVIYLAEEWKQATTGTAGNGLIDTIIYKAGGEEYPEGYTTEGEWHPASEMCWTMSRALLKITDCYPMRLQSIGNNDAQAEGFFECTIEAEGKVLSRRSAKEYLADEWNKWVEAVHANNYRWEANPIVWVVEFQLVHRYGGKP